MRTVTPNLITGLATAVLQEVGQAITYEGTTTPTNTVTEHEQQVQGRQGSKF